MFEYFEGWYNVRRLHSSLNYRSAEWEALHRNTDRQAAWSSQLSCPPNRIKPNRGIGRTAGADPHLKPAKATAAARRTT